MSDFLLSDIAGNLRDAKDCLDSAIRDIDSYACGYEDEGTPEMLEKLFASDADLKVLYARLDALQKEIDALWTPALKARLKEEEDLQSHLEDGWDAASY